MLRIPSPQQLYTECETGTSCRRRFLKQTLTETPKPKLQSAGEKENPPGKWLRGEMTQQIEALSSKLDSVPGTPGPAALEVLVGLRTHVSKGSGALFWSPRELYLHAQTGGRVYPRPPNTH